MIRCNYNETYSGRDGASCPHEATTRLAFTLDARAKLQPNERHRIAIVVCVDHAVRIASETVDLGGIDRFTRIGSPEDLALTRQLGL